MHHLPLQLERIVEVNCLVSFHYRELPKQFHSPEQSYDFWKLIYVDKGSLTVLTDRQNHELKQGDVLLSPPHVPYSIKASLHTPPNVMVIGYTCRQDMLDAGQLHLFSLDDSELRQLAGLTREGTRLMEASSVRHPPHLEQPQQTDLAWRSRLQLVRNQLELLLLVLHQRHTAVAANCSLRPRPRKLLSTQQKHHEAAMAENIIAFIRRSELSELRMDRICREFAISRTHLSMIFKHATGISVMEYVRQYKIAKAKTLLREEAYTCTQIADLLGYCSIHYFSKDFKKWTGSAPTEYAKSLRARM